MGVVEVLLKMLHFINDLMQKNSEKIFSTIEVDPVTGDYHVTIPEVIINEMQWYEETKLRWLVDGDEIVLTEEKES